MESETLEMKPKHPITNKPIPTGRPSGNSHQRRKARRAKTIVVTAVDLKGKTVTISAKDFRTAPLRGRGFQTVIIDETA